MASGVCLGAATLVKQVAIAPVVVFVPGPRLASLDTRVDMAKPKSARHASTSLHSGSAWPQSWRLAAAILIARGAGAIGL